MEKKFTKPSDRITSMRYWKELIRLSRRLRRWHERLCGDSYGVVEEEEDGRCFFLTYEGHRYRVRNMGRAAERRVAEIMAKFPELVYYIQGDPRGPALYILNKEDVDPALPLASQYLKGEPIY